MDPLRAGLKLFIMKQIAATKAWNKLGSIQQCNCYKIVETENLMLIITVRTRQRIIQLPTHEINLSKIYSLR